MSKNYFEAVEMCPFCESENTYPMWDVNTKGYTVKCNHCGKEIMLCDECTHAEDNPLMSCDWCKTECGGKCFRGITKD
jgi:Zn ribbon nucleic-acid-binding protein